MPDNWGLIGHEWAVQLLQGQIATGHLRQAYLLGGPQGTGRRTLALRAAQALNCENPPSSGEFCGECRPCRGFGRGQHPDLLLVERQDGDRDIKVDAVRELSRGLSRTPLEARTQVALILHFEQASEGAANALLKTLEEPNPSALIFLTATDEDSLPATIVSRCEVIRLRPVPVEQVAGGLSQRAGLPVKEATLLANLSAGRPGLALRWHQQPGLVEQRGEWLDACQQLMQAGKVERFAFAETASKDRETMRAMLVAWLSFWRDVLLRASGSSAPVANVDRQPQLEAIAGKLGFSAIKGWVTKVQETLEQLDTNVNARLAMEVLLL